MVQRGVIHLPVNQGFGIKGSLPQTYRGNFDFIGKEGILNMFVYLSDAKSMLKYCLNHLVNVWNENNLI